MDVRKEIERMAKEHNLSTDEVGRLFLLELRFNKAQDRIVFDRKTNRYHYTKEYDRIRKHY